MPLCARRLDLRQRQRHGSSAPIPAGSRSGYRTDTHPFPNSHPRRIAATVPATPAARRERTAQRRLAPTAVALAVAGTLAGAGASFGAKPLVVQVSGAISSITPQRIQVRHLSCSIRSTRTQHLAARFVVGDRVRIVCRGGVLERLRHAAVGTSITPPLGTSTDSSQPPSGQPTVTIAVGGEATTRGTITAFGPSGADGCPPPTAGSRNLGNCASITINSVTCAISQDLYAVIRSEYTVGDTATIFCDQSGQLRAIGPRGI